MQKYNFLYEIALLDRNLEKSLAELRGVRSVSDAGKRKHRLAEAFRRLGSGGKNLSAVRNGLMLPVLRGRGQRGFPGGGTLGAGTNGKAAVKGKRKKLVPTGLFLGFWHGFCYL